MCDRRECGVNLGKAEFPQGESISPCEMIKQPKVRKTKKEATTKSLLLFDAVNQKLEKANNIKGLQR